MANTGELGVLDAVLNFSHILASGATIVGPDDKFGTSTIVVTQAVNVIFEITVPAVTDIDIDGTWTQDVTSSIKMLAANSTIAVTDAGDHNWKFGDATTTIGAFTQTASPGLFTPFASSTVSLTGGDSESGILPGDASSGISLTDSSDKQTSILSVFASNTLAMTDLVQNNSFAVSASNALSLGQSESVNTNPKRVVANNTIAATDSSDFTQGALGRSAENTIVFLGFNPDGDPPSPAPGWDTVTSNFFNLFAANPDKEGDAPESLLIGFTDDWLSEGVLPLTFDLAASSVIVASQNLPQPTGKRSVEASNIISITDILDNKSISRLVITTIVPTQTAIAEKIIRAVSTLTMTDIVDEGFVNLFAGNTIILGQFVRPNPIERAPSNTLALTQSAKSSITNVFAENTVVPTQDINVQRPFRVDAENEIAGIEPDIFFPPSGPILIGLPFGISDEATVALDVTRDPTTLISIGDQARPVLLKVGAIALTATSSIGFVQVANISSTADAVTLIDSLSVQADANLNTIDLFTSIDELTGTAIVQIDRSGLLGASIINLGQSVAYSLFRDTTECEYSPFVGASNSPTEPPRPTLPDARTPALDPSIRFRLVYPPFDTGDNVDTLDLRAPVFGNRERLEATRIQRETTGGTLTVFADPIWPKVHSLQMQFTALKTEQARGLLTFLERWIGQEIGLYDYEGRIWKGVITNPDEAVIHDGRENYSATLEIEAERIQESELSISALTSLGMTDVSEGLATLFPGASPLVVSDSASFVKVPVGASNSAISFTQFATRNAFFVESASSPINLGHSGRELDFNDFGNLVHNWDARDIPDATGTSISIWADSIGSIDLTASGAFRPTVRDAILNGERVVEFRHSVSVQRMISNTELPVFDNVNKTGTIFMVLTIREAMNNDNNLVFGTNPGSPDSTVLFIGGTTSTQRPVAYKSPEGIVALETPTSVLGNNTSHQFAWSRNGNNVAFRRNKVTQDGHTLATNPTPLTDDLYVGGLGSGNSADMDIAQILVYDDILDLADIKAIEGLLSAVWGV